MNLCWGRRQRRREGVICKVTGFLGLYVIGWGGGREVR